MSADHDRASIIGNEAFHNMAEHILLGIANSRDQFPTTDPDDDLALNVLVFVLALMLEAREEIEGDNLQEVCDFAAARLRYFFEIARSDFLKCGVHLLECFTGPKTPGRFRTI